MTATVLVVDDDPAIRQALADELALAGFAAITAADGEEALIRFAAEAPDLVLTDLAMPRLDGFEVIRRVRRAGATPVIVLSVRGEESDKIRALDLGADDHVSKPFSMGELLARVRAQLRRHGVDTDRLLSFPGLEIDRDRRLVRRDSQDIRLTPTEYSILDLLASNAGKPVTLRQIIARVWHGAPATSPDTVRVHVGTLRKKLEPDPTDPRYVVTEPWVGYRFLPEPVEPDER
jgi:two-component system KDP operon response regulator KdpE